MIRRLFDPLFICYGLLWLLVQGFRKAGVIITIFNDYLTDLIAVPAIAHLTITIIRTYIVKDRSYNYPFGYVLFIAVYLSVVFEWLMPGFSRVYTGDPGDMIAYGCGVLFYYFVHGKMKTGKKGNRSKPITDPASALLR
ncbi:hypothetical protein [Pseudobacter ginsenosidimutans]|uniref:Magnesium citrate secondary transporter n=1 Tax=Pseudobacter ginsenosidimutans TaxID=661488 RepID=A0A4Q7MUB4_9BACT|nr:hypothetical protein [Pseudobacter ginsenosidimutans]QEC42474.1 hypothetical protein FSB84_12505 [Pseudobacter ginsenosidimutans]RZS70673.1 hypothetical protein EV199_2566 [Pseudobacter ginsenosidimutans]